MQSFSVPLPRRRLSLPLLPFDPLLEPLIFIPLFLHTSIASLFISFIFIRLLEAGGRPKEASAMVPGKHHCCCPSSRDEVSLLAKVALDQG